MFIEGIVFRKSCDSILYDGKFKIIYSLSKCLIRLFNRRIVDGLLLISFKFCARMNIGLVVYLKAQAFLTHNITPKWFLLPKGSMLFLLHKMTPHSTSNNCLYFSFIDLKLILIKCLHIQTTFTPMLPTDQLFTFRKFVLAYFRIHKLLRNYLVTTHLDTHVG